MMHARATARTGNHTLRRLLAYMKRAWLLLGALLFSSAAASLLDLAVPWVIGFVLLDRAIKNGSMGDLWLAAGLLAAIFLAQRVFAFLKDYLHEVANQRIVHAIRCDLFEHMLALPVRFFDRRRSGELLARTTSDVDAVEGLLGILVQDILSDVILLCGTLSFLYAVSPQLSLYLAPTVIVLALSVLLFKRTVKRFARRIRDLLGEMAALAGEVIAGVRIVKAFHGESFELRRFAAKSRELVQGRVRAAGLQAGYSTAIELCVFAGTLIVILVATPWVIAGKFTVGALVAYLSYVNKLYGPVKKLSKVNLSVQKILAAGDRIFEVMDVEPEPAPPALHPAPRFDGELSFDRVRFAYSPERPALKDFSLHVSAGEMVALVGHSGGGKTTIVSLLMRFYSPDSGSIRIDGVPLENIPLSVLRRQIAIVPQETFLLSGTVRENIAYAEPGAGEEEIIEAARAAYAHDFISRLPEGYDSQVGERGVQLSAGQRQRIAVARALLRRPRILIFDEATSQLDAESEHLIQKTLDRISEGRTVLLIAHRLSTIRKADRIVVIEGGEVAEIGTHQELLENAGIYRRLHLLQVGAAAMGPREK